MRVGSFSGGDDLRTLFEAVGIGWYNIPMAIQYAFMLPGTTDPDAQGVMLLVEGLQRRLKELGYPVEVDGWLGPRTSAAVEEVSGARWRDKTWAQLLGDAVEAKPMNRMVRALGAALYDLEPLGVDTGSYSLTPRGSCAPKDEKTLGQFREYQRQANRVASHLKIGRIAVDGVLGAKSVAQARKIGWSKHPGAEHLSYMARSGLGQVTDCAGLARMADTISGSLRAAADRMGVPGSVRGAGGGAQVMQAPDGSIVGVKEPGLLDQLVSSPLALAAVGVGGLLLWKKTKKKRRRK